jgi:hypothetical protein
MGLITSTLILYAYFTMSRYLEILIVFYLSLMTFIKIKIGKLFLCVHPGQMSSSKSVK